MFKGDIRNRFLPRIPFLQFQAVRKSSVNGNSGFGTAGAGFILPGVWPWRKKRARRRLSASY